jgi:uncharacterized membrane protein
MIVLVNLLIWAHIAAFGLGMAGGLGMAQVGPRLVAAAPDRRETWWPLAKTFSLLTGIAFVALLVTGPLVLWLKWNGGQGLSVWFMVKMALVVLALVLFGLGKVGMARLKRGDEAGGRLMSVAGRLTGLTVLALVLAAVFAFG